VDVYLLCGSEPLKSDSGMKDQIGRAVCSMSDNIAQGFEYNNNPVLPGLKLKVVRLKRCKLS
jgi:four helix bundle protein